MHLLSFFTVWAFVSIIVQSMCLNIVTTVTKYCETMSGLLLRAAHIAPFAGTVSTEMGLRHKVTGTVSHSAFRKLSSKELAQVAAQAPMDRLIPARHAAGDFDNMYTCKCYSWLCMHTKHAGLY